MHIRTNETETRLSCRLLSEDSSLVTGRVGWCFKKRERNELKFRRVLPKFYEMGKARHLLVCSQRDFLQFPSFGKER